MLSFTAPKDVRKVADRFKDTQTMSYASLCSLLALHFFGLASLSELVRCCVWVASVSSLQRSVSKFDSNRWMRRIQASVLKKIASRALAEPERFCFAADETKNIKYGKRIFGVGSWPDSSGLYRGQRIVVIALVDKIKGVALPLAYRFCSKKDDPCYQSTHDLVASMAEEIIEAGYPPLPITLDSFYDSTKLMEKLEAMKIPFCIETKTSRVVKNNRAPRSKWYKWAEFFRGKIRYSVRISGSNKSKEKRYTKYFSESVAFIRGRLKPLRAACMYNTIKDKASFAIYVTNDMSKSGAWLWEMSRARWHLEEFFRIAKQSFSFGKLPCIGKAAADLSVCMPIAWVTSFYFDTLQDTAPPDTVGQRLQRLRDAAFTDAITSVIVSPASASVKRLLSRMHSSRVKSKPVDFLADEIDCWIHAS